VSPDEGYRAPVLSRCALLRIVQPFEREQVDEPVSLSRSASHREGVGLTPPCLRPVRRGLWPPASSSPRRAAGTRGQ
jgi:hypothetical protein